MAETASILSPEKTVLLPEINAGCPMADMATGKGIRELKNKHPTVPVVCYINTTADVKTESDICCTSANAEKIVASIDADEIIFVPDKNLGSFAANKTGKKLILWNGYCPVHVNILKEHVLAAKKNHPKAEVLVHPECNTEFIIGTELGIIHRLKKENPDKSFYPASEFAVCKNMKKITLEKVLWALEENKNIISVDTDTRNKASKCITKMLELSK
jgi:quinolinate synthase